VSGKPQLSAANSGSSHEFAHLQEQKTPVAGVFLSKEDFFDPYPGSDIPVNQPHEHRPARREQVRRILLFDFLDL
jgi:hypothetical protein